MGVSISLHRVPLLLGNILHLIVVGLDAWVVGMGLALRLLVRVLVWLWYGASLLLLSMLGGIGHRAMEGMVIGVWEEGIKLIIVATLVNLS